MANVDPELYKELPHTVADSLERYFEHHIQPGGFLMAVLENDLAGAAIRADNINRYHITDIAKWISFYAPPGSVGSEENVRNWLKGKTND